MIPTTLDAEPVETSQARSASMSASAVPAEPSTVWPLLASPHSWPKDGSFGVRSALTTKFGSAYATRGSLPSSLSASSVAAGSPAASCVRPSAVSFFFPFSPAEARASSFFESVTPGRNLTISSPGTCLRTCPGGTLSGSRAAPDPPASVSAKTTATKADHRMRAMRDPSLKLKKRPEGNTGPEKCQRVEAARPPRPV